MRKRRQRGRGGGEGGGGGGGGGRWGERRGRRKGEDQLHVAAYESYLPIADSSVGSPGYS